MFLRAEDVRHVRVVENGEAVGRQFADLFQCAAEARHGLQRQAVDEVGADAVVSRFARRDDGVADVFEGLDAVHRFLHTRVEVLHAKADAVEAQSAQETEVGRGDGARVDFDAEFAFAIRSEMREMCVQHGKQALHLRVVKEGGRTAAEVQLDDAAAFVDMRCLTGDVAFEVIKVIVGLAVVVGDDFVAAAVVADVFAEGNVDVEREVAFARVAGIKVAGVVGGGEAVVKFDGGRVGGVARAALAIFLDQRGVKVLAHGDLGVG